MKRVLYSLLFATLAGALVFGAAASLQVTSQDLGSGGDPVASCDADGVTTTFTFVSGDPSLVESIDVNGIDDPACNGDTVHVAVYDGGTSIANGNATHVSGGTVSVPLSSNAGASLIDEVVVTIVGTP
jgi:hypothetical protein